METSGGAGILLTYVVPVMLLLLPLAFLVAGLWCTARNKFPYAAKASFFFALHGLTLFCSMLVFIFKAKLAMLPANILTLTPLFFALAYLAVGAALPSRLIWAVGLTTPGLALICQKSWAALSGVAAPFFLLPTDPIWYILGGAIIFALRYTPRTRAFWEEMEAAHLNAGVGYLFIGLWLLSIGGGGFLSIAGLSLQLWAVFFAAAAAAVAWCATLMRDRSLLACSALGLMASVISFVLYFPKK